ncbi:MAG: hypothetical protein VX642_15675 [Bdellovibrionota bacterium]|nr:hypothetical protein [Bdellovibrionota bacterium]
MKANLVKRLFVMTAATLSLVACEDIPTVSILSETEDFVQAASEVNNKIDILWVVDNSGSMHDSQTALANNFEAFINDLQNKNYDFQIAVIATDAYRGGDYAKFKAEGGQAILTNNTTNLEIKFIENVMVGTRGSANERGLQSLETALDLEANKAFDFPRSDAFFSVIFVSDEQDSSIEIGGSSFPGSNHYLGILDTLRLGSTLAGQKTYSLNAIVLRQEDVGCTSGTVGQRYIDIVNDADGIVASICSDFSTSLTDITSSIVQLSTQFYLNREPVIESINVVVNGEIVPQDTENGWEYVVESNSIVFHGSAIPAQGASILVDFDPVSLIN